MNDTQINLVKTTWESLTPNADKVARLFYSNLFEMEPEYREMFGTDMESQGKKLMMMLNTAVRSLDVIESVVPAVQALGQRHVKTAIIRQRPTLPTPIQTWYQYCFTTRKYMTQWIIR